MEADIFIAAPPARVAERLRDPGWQLRWSAGLTLMIYADRGAEGCRAVVSGELAGSCEWWVEPVRGGAVVHFWLRAAQTASGQGLMLRRVRPGLRGIWWRRRERLFGEKYLRRWRAAMFACKDELEAK